MRISVTQSDDGNAEVAAGCLSALVCLPVNAALIAWAAHLLLGMWEAGEPDMWSTFWALLLLRLAW